MRSLIIKLFPTHYIVFVCLLLARQPPTGQGLVIIEVSRTYTTTHHSRQDSSGRVISLSQRPLLDNTQRSLYTDLHAPVGFEPTISADERPQTYALYRAATGTCYIVLIGTNILVSRQFSMLLKITFLIPKQVFDWNCKRNKFLSS